MGRKWYSVDLPANITVRVNPRAEVNGVAVLGNNELVAIFAVRYAEGLPKKDRLFRGLCAWADSQSIEGKRWVAKSDTLAGNVNDPR